MTKEELEKISENALKLSYKVTGNQGTAVPTVIGALAAAYIRIAVDAEPQVREDVRKILLE